LRQSLQLDQRGWRQPSLASSDSIVRLEVSCHVNQVLRAEEKRGTIELLRGRTRIRDLEALQARAR
jgi:hypothetical protein